MKTFTLFTFLIASVLAFTAKGGETDYPGSYKSQSCSRHDTQIIFKHESDYRDSCVAISRVEDFFKTMGQHDEAPIRVVFQEKVTEQVSDGNTIIVYGKFKEQSNTLFITSSQSDLYDDVERKEFGVEIKNDQFREQYHMSRLVQHISSFYIYDNLDQNGVDEIDFALEKFIAYTVQISTMDHELKSKILEKNPGLRFESQSSINSIIHNDDPQKFGIMSYRYFHSSSGGSSFLSRILRGEVQLKEQEKK